MTSMETKRKETANERGDTSQFPAQGPEGMRVLLSVLIKGFEAFLGNILSRGAGNHDASRVRGEVYRQES